MREAKARLSGATICGGGDVICRDDQVRALSFVDGVQKPVSIKVSQTLQQVEAEIAANDGSVGEGSAAFFAHALKAPADN